ncbi:MAG: hypothetical protein ACREV6_15575 [Clostridium sp.]|uniref:hypothetical protein n=1 Tax=Clostridium sp. TaxID=1506 RepID=UPI003D6CF9C3
MYLITREQFDSIHEQEGKHPSWYDKAEILGSKAGIPIITITNSKRLKEDVMPSDDYIEVIKKGIQGTYPDMAELDIDAYLMRRFLKNIEQNI